MSSDEANIEVQLVEQSVLSKRMTALGVAGLAIALLCIALFLNPSPEGVGTHHQLGLPKCGWILAANIPCPTCGMTTAWSHTVRGELPSAFLAQPLGMLLAIATMVIAVCALGSALLGISFQFVLFRLMTTKVWIAIAGIAIVSWGFKILIHRGVL